MTKFYILTKDKELQEVKSVLEWAKFMEDVKNRIIKVTDLQGYRVSTVFIGFDFTSYHVKCFFETLVFKDGISVAIATEAYPTYEPAMDGHYRIVDQVKGIIEKKRHKRIKNE